MPLVRVLSDMEMAGIAVNVQFLKEMSVTITQQLGQFEEKIYEQVGHSFKIGSTKQLAGVLFDELGLKGLRRTRTGYSTDANTLSALRNDHPVVPLILEHRQLAKLKSTYVDALPLMVNPNTNRVHTSYNQIGAATGRLSSTDPNLQNIPVRTELGRQVRKAFITESDEYTLLSADYSQIELRLLAHMTEDPNLIAAFNAGQDIHAATAGQVLGVPLDQVTSDMRRSAKAINFGIIYGISDYGLSVQLGIRPAEAGEFIRQYFARYPLVQQYLDSVIQQGVDGGLRQYYVRPPAQHAGPEGVQSTDKIGCRASGDQHATARRRRGHNQAGDDHAARETGESRRLPDAAPGSRRVAIRG